MNLMHAQSFIEDYNLTFSLLIFSLGQASREEDHAGEDRTGQEGCQEPQEET